VELVNLFAEVIDTVIAMSAGIDCPTAARSR